jgi:hypothetical protein
MKKLAGVLTLVALASTGVSFAATKGKADKGVAYVSATHSEGKTLFVSGDVKDKLLGRGGIVYQTTVSAGNQPGTFLVKAKAITLFTTKGTLTGKGQGTETIAQDGTTTVSGGTFKLNKGTGAYKGHVLSGKFGGPLTNNVYKFSYKAVYK